jgi:hypothetical protein
MVLKLLYHVVDLLSILLPCHNLLLLIVINVIETVIIFIL